MRCISKRCRFIFLSYSYNVSVKLFFQCHHWTIVSIKKYVIGGQIYKNTIIKSKLRAILDEKFITFLFLDLTPKRREPWCLVSSNYFLFLSHPTPPQNSLLKGFSESVGQASGSWLSCLYCSIHFWCFLQMEVPYLP